MKESDKILLIYKVLNESETSLEDRVLYQELANGSDSDRALVDDVNKIFELTGDINKVKPEIDVEASKMAFFDKLEAINVGSNNTFENKEPIVRRLYSRKLMSIAAAFLVLIAAVFVFNTFLGGTTYTSNDNVSLIKLEDGTKVWLAKGSKLSVGNRYNKNLRNTVLVGDAYFEVHRSINKPFTVDVNDNIVEVIGTKFQVNSVDKEILEVLVFSGKVKVTNKNDEYLFLEKGEGVKLNTENKLEPFSLENSSTTTSKENYLVFNNESLSKVAERLSQYFDVKISFDCKDIDSYEGYTSPGYGGDKIDVYFKMIEKVFDVKVHNKDNNSYIIICNE